MELCGYCKLSCSYSPIIPQLPRSGTNLNTLRHRSISLSSSILTFPPTYEGMQFLRSNYILIQYFPGTTGWSPYCSRSSPSSYTRNKDYFHPSHIITRQMLYLNPNDITNGEIFLLIVLQEKRTSIKTRDILLQV